MTHKGKGSGINLEDILRETEHSHSTEDSSTTEGGDQAQPDSRSSTPKAKKNEKTANHGDNDEDYDDVALDRDQNQDDL